MLGEQIAGDPLRPVLADTLRALEGSNCTSKCTRTRPIQPGGLTLPRWPSRKWSALSTLLRRFKSAGFAFNRRAASASLMLRYGWASGFTIAAYLTRVRVPFLRDFAMYFSPGALLKSLWVRDAQFVGFAEDPLAGGPEWMETVTP